jgi:hypothetical protein
MYGVAGLWLAHLRALDALCVMAASCPWLGSLTPCNITEGSGEHTYAWACNLPLLPYKHGVDSQVSIVLSLLPDDVLTWGYVSVLGSNMSIDIVPTRRAVRC